MKIHVCKTQFLRGYTVSSHIIFLLDLHPVLVHHRRREKRKGRQSYPPFCRFVFKSYNITYLSHNIKAKQNKKKKIAAK